MIQQPQPTTPRCAARWMLWSRWPMGIGAAPCATFADRQLVAAARLGPQLHRRCSPHFSAVVTHSMLSIPAVNKWGSVSPVMGWLTFLSLFHQVGRAAWLQAWPLQAFATLAPEDDGDSEMDATGEDGHQVNTRRLISVSKWWANAEAGMWTAILNSALLPVDGLLQYMEWADSHVNRKKVVKPLMLQMVDGVSSPMAHTQRQLCALLLSGSDLHVILEAAQASKTTLAHRAQGRRPGWGPSARKALIAVIHASAGLFRRLEVTYQSYPARLFAIANAPDATAKWAEAQAAFMCPPCCQDEEFTSRLIRLLTSPNQLTHGPVAELLQSAASELSLVITDLEAMHAVNKQLGSSKVVPSVERVRYESFIREWVVENRHRGFTPKVSLTKAEFAKAGVLTAASRCSSTYKKRRRRQGAPAHACSLQRLHFVVC